jgi:thiamine biosynthesis protein ThiS
MNVRYGRETHTFKRSLTVKTILERLEIVPAGVIVAVNGQLVTRDERVQVGDDVEIIRAISGGR